VLYIPKLSFTNPFLADIIELTYYTNCNIKYETWGDGMSGSFSIRLSELRRQAGYSQRKTATDLGISQALLSHYENGIREPKLDFVVKACDYYGVSADYILGRSDKKGSGEEIEALVKKVHDLSEYTDQLFINSSKRK
jgi:transcriptional regulator with XRE-family HTH domain